jgi:putative acetyltransferase
VNFAGVCSLLILRPYQRDDALTLLDLFKDTIRRINCRDYTPEQVGAWASDEIDPVGWASRFEGRFVMVAEYDSKTVGFGELEPDGHIDRFYVSADHQSQGIGSSILNAIVKEANRMNLEKLFVEASITAKPFFSHHGFGLVQEQVVSCRSIEFVNYRMEKQLNIQ